MFIIVINGLKYTIKKELDQQSSSTEILLMSQTVKLPRFKT